MLHLVLSLELLAIVNPLQLGDIAHDAAVSSTMATTPVSIQPCTVGTLSTPISPETFASKHSPSESTTLPEGTTLSPTNSDGATSTAKPSVADSDVSFPTASLSPIAQAPEGFTVFPVGLNLRRRNAIPSLLVRGREDGVQAIDFDKWLLPYDAVIQALKLSTKALPDGQVELRSPSFVTRIDPKKLYTDPELGLVFSIRDLQTLFDVKAEFDINDYAVQLNPAWLDQSGQTNEPTEIPVQLEGLAHIRSPAVTLTAIEQRVNVNGSQTSPLNYQGDLTAVGTVLGGSWFIHANQPKLQNSQTWTLAEARIQRQTNQADYILGSQPPFWRKQGMGDYWGFTTIQRQGFRPMTQFYGESDPRQRLQAAQIGRTISGRAEPGTLVRLTQAFGDRVIAEVLVDSSGIYRFENVQVDNQLLGSNYRVLLYPQGRLTAQPEIRDATFSTVPGQIPAFASALIASGGFRRELSQNSGFLGDFSEFRGGIAQRWGVSEDLTVGIGGVYDQSVRGLGELFFRPKNFPLEVAVLALTGDQWDVNADIRFNPSPTFNTSFSSDRNSSRFNLNWQMFPGFTLLGTYDSRDGAAIGGQITRLGKNAFTFARATIDTQNRFRWSLLQRLGRLELNQQGNEIRTLSELTYNFSKTSSFNSGQSLVLNYETSNLQKGSDKLATLAWRYRSPQRAVDGNYLWEAQVGYGTGSQGSGLSASLGTTLIPGLLLRARYQGVSVTSDEATFSIDLLPSFNLQRGITAGDRHSDYLRTQGGLLIQPFFDRNGNGKRDAGEEAYTDSPDLFILNNKPIQSFRVETQGDRLLLRLPPGTYRLDLDPVGFPPDWQASVDAEAVDVVAGSYTPVLVPLISSYTLSGVLTDAQGNPINGARVEAVSTSSGQRLFSVTNGAGVYYLERLQQGAYTLQINGKPAQRGTITIDKTSQAFQELNLQQP